MMEKIYIAIAPKYSESDSYYRSSRTEDKIVTDNINLLAKYQKDGWNCYLVTEMKKIESFETLIFFEETEEAGAR